MLIESDSVGLDWRLASWSSLGVFIWALIIHYCIRVYSFFLILRGGL